MPRAGSAPWGWRFNRGGALIIKKRFSVSEFWSDIHKYRATMFVYIGECAAICSMRRAGGA